MPTPSPDRARPSTREPTRRNKKAERLERILDVAARRFYEQGYAQCTLADIGDELDMHKASLYYYVSSKEDLLEQVILRVSSRLRAAVEDIVESDSPVDRLERIVRNHVQVVLEQRESFGVLIEQRRHIDPAVLERIAPREQRYLDTIRALLKELQSSGLIDETDDRLRFRMTIDMLNGVVRWHPDGARIEATVDHVWERMAKSLGLQA